MTQMIQAKREGQTVGAEAPRKRAPVIDLMQALQKSLGDLPRKTGREGRAERRSGRAGWEERAQVETGTAHRARVIVSLSYLQLSWVASGLGQLRPSNLPTRSVGASISASIALSAAVCVRCRISTGEAHLWNSVRSRVRRVPIVR